MALRVYIRFLRVPVRVVLILLLTTLVPIQSQAQCSPTLREIFDFEVGDEFYYCVSISDYFTDSGSRFHQRKRVTSLEWIGDTLTIIFSVHNTANGAICESISNFQAREFKDTLIVVDTLSHCLNSCVRDTIPAPWMLDFTVHERYVAVTQGPDEDPDVKAFGDHRSFLHMTSADTMAYTGNLGYRCSWQAKRGLGVVKQNWQNGYDLENTELVGWIKGGEVFGLVNQRTIVEPTPAEPISNATILGESEPFRLQYVPGTARRVQVFAMDGRLCFDRSGNIGQEVWLSHLNTGSYVVVVATETEQYKYRIIKPRVVNYLPAR